MAWLRFNHALPPLHLPLYQERLPLAALPGLLLERSLDTAGARHPGGQRRLAACRAALVRRGERHVLEWAEEQDGFNVNGRRVTGRVVLQDGDQLAIGPAISSRATYHNPAADAGRPPDGADGFLRAIAADPDDESLRLIFADWLDEQGDPWAGFIRLQCDLARRDLPPWDDPGERTERELLLRHGDRWAGAVPGLVNAWRFRRGFVESVDVDATALATHADTLFRLAPVREVCLAGLKPERLGPLLSGPALARVDSLRFAPSSAAPLCVELLDRCPFLGRVTRLVLPPSGGVGSWGVEVVSRAPALERLAELDLRWSGVHGPDLEPLLRAPAAARLRALDLGGNALGGDGLLRLVADDPLPALAELGLGSTQTDADGVALLAAAPLLGRLRQLDLDANRLPPAAARSLAGSPRAAGLRHLSLAFNVVGGSGLRALAASPHLAGLVSLDLRNNGADDAGARALVESPHLDRLRRLDLRGNGLSAEVRQALAGRFGADVCLFVTS
jgi:uncharacterized protein (TIGR02996 family)